MSLIEVANSLVQLNHKAGSVITGGVFIITSVPSIKVKAVNQGVHKKEIEYTFSGGSASGFVAGSITTTAPQKILPSATKVKVEGDFIMRKGDFGTMNAIGTVPPPPPGVTSPVSGLVEISQSGQSKVKAQ